MIKKSIISSILLFGATAMVAQIVLVREFIIIFYGNEISIGFILASWLFLGALGAIFLGKVADNIKTRIESFAVCEIFLSLLLPLSIILIRVIKKVSGIVPGEIIGLLTMIGLSLIILAPLCIILGFLFALSCRIYKLNDPSLRIGKVYILEAMGSAAGGIVASFLLIKYLSSFEIMVVLSLSNTIAALVLSKGFSKSTFKILFRTSSFLLLSVVLVFIATGYWQRVDKKSLEFEWRPLKLVATRNSIYSNLAVTKTDVEISFFSNGLHAFSVPDELTQEEAVHFAMLEHDRPKEILLIGGGLGGLLWEILKYPVERVDYVELDPLIIEMGRHHLRDTKYFIGQNPKVNIINIDGRFWVKNTSKKYDVIILNLPNPFTAQINRFYTIEFFRELKQVMKPKAVLSFGVTSSENYISKELANFLSSINNTLKEVFSDIKIIPGDSAYFLASLEKDLLNLDYSFFESRLKERGIETKFVRESYIMSKLSKDRLDYIERALKENGSSLTNQDFKPISYYYDMLLWATHFTGPLKKILNLVTEKRIWFVFALLYALLLAVVILIGKKEKLISRMVMTAIGTTGFSEIAFEITVILAFQVVYGFMYYKLGLMFSSFMAGLTLGSFYITKILPQLKNNFALFTKVQFFIVIYPLVLPPIFMLLSGRQTPFISWLGSNVIFPLLPIIAGFIGGLQFPLGAKIYLGTSNATARAGGLAYGVDLIGACLGAVIISSFLIPILGIFKTCFMISVLNLGIFIALSSLKLDKAIEK